MAQMIRKQIYIDADNERFLKRRSSELGITEAEVVRQALADAAERVVWDKRREALEDILAYIREHRMGAGSQNGWKFNRDELYEERMEQIMRRPESHEVRTGS